MAKRGSRHRVPTPPPRPHGDDVDPAYAAEVELHTGRRQRAYENAQRRLAHATAEAQRRERGREAQARLDEGWRLVQVRRDELAAIERAMQPGNHASAQHLGVDSYRKVPR